MIKISVAEAKAKLSEYLDRALAGEQIVICRHNKPIAELRGLEESRAEPRAVGPLPGRPTFELPATFFEPLPDDELELWEDGGVPLPLPARSRAAPVPHAAEGRSTYRRSRTPRRRRS